MSKHVHFRWRQSAISTLSFSYLPLAYSKDGAAISFNTLQCCHLSNDCKTREIALDLCTQWFLL